MKTIKIIPNDWSCTLEECPPGFFWYGNDLCFKSEYNNECYCSSGEYFALRDILVQPVAIVTENN